MLPESQQRAFDRFYASARGNQILDPKATVIVQMAASMALGCYPCMRHYLRQADEVGLTEEELGAVQAIVMAVSAGKVNAQFQDALATLGSGGAAPCVDCTDSAQADEQGRLVCA